MEKATANTRGRRNEIIGRVISDKMDKTISVLVYRSVRHKKYGKTVRRTSVFKAHDENKSAKVGDTVMIYETKPLSKTKRWMLSKILEQATQVQGVNL
jgi:small subunit ribosomal protein S17